VQTALAEIARKDVSPIVRRQLACTVKRLKDNDVWPIIDALLTHDEDADDPQIPLLLWWAIESKATGQREAIGKLFSTPAIQQRALVRQHILGRLARRYSAEANDPDFAVCAQLLKAAPSASETDIILKGMEAGLIGRRFQDIPAPLHNWVRDNVLKSNPSDAVLRIAMRLGDGHARARAHITIKNTHASESTRLEFIEILGQLEYADSLEPLLELFRKSGSEKYRRATLSALQHYSELGVAKALLETYPSLNADLQARVRNAFCSRSGWATLLVDAVEAGRIAAKDVSLDQIRQMAALKDASLNTRIEKHWGKFKADSPQDKRNFINQVKLVLKPSGAAGRDAKGDPGKGRAIFNQACGLCHKLFGEGGTIGPDLTGAERKNIDVLLANIVMPSAYIRPEFVNFDAETKDGQSVNGLMVESTPTAVTLVDRNNQRHTFARDQVQSLRESELSLMPDGLLEAMQPQQLMDLFSFLQSDGAPAQSK
jgi:putative heme-binding domain-containing protein